MKSTSATATHGPWRVTGLNGSALTCTPVGRARRQGLWWLHYGPAQWPGLDEGVELVGHASAARERALIGAVDLVDRLSNDVRLSGWTFHIRPEPEQRRVTVIGTVPR